MAFEEKKTSKQAGPKVITRTEEMTSLDELTHDFTNNAGYRKSMLDKYGQYFSHDGRRVLR